MILYFVEEFTGRMNVELSFLVDGDMYKAVMQKEKSCTELEKSELVTIRLFEQDRSIFLRFTEENGKVDLRYNKPYKPLYKPIMYLAQNPPCKCDVNP